MIFPDLPDPQRLALFIVTALVVLVTPGPAVLYIVARSIGEGLRTGIASAVGMTLGGLFHLGLVLAGFAAIVIDNPDVRDGLQLAGSVFLVYLGVSRFLDKSPEVAEEGAGPVDTPRTRSRSAVIDAAIVNVLNPKAIIFLFAFLPQFALGDTAEALQGQLLVYGIVFISLGLTTDLAFAFAASSARRAFIAKPGRMRAVQRVSGIFLASLGLAGILRLVA